MNKRFLNILATVTLSSFLSLHAQTLSFKQHRVNKGETVTEIAQQYKVTVKDILKYNPEANNGLKENTFLSIPLISGLEQTSHTAKSHLVESKETLYGISKKYQLSIDELYRLNPSLKENGLRSGEILLLEPNVSAVTPIVKLDTLVASSAQLLRNGQLGTKTIIVGPKETVYGLAIQHQTTIQRLFELNQNLESLGLVEGQTLIVPSKKESKEELQLNAVNNNNSKVSYREITVKPKETLFNLSKEYDVSTEQLIALNPELNYGLKVGMLLKIPTSEKSVSKTPINTAATYVTGQFKDLTRSISKDQSKQLVLLLPFNAHKINTSAEDIQEKLKKDAFLNMTLDFYSGALIAIDSAKSLGLPLDVAIYDSKETNATSDVAAIFKKEDFAKTEVIIGPFFQKNVAQTAALIKDRDIVLVSPLSTEKSTSGLNQIQTMPNTDDLRSALVDYMLRHNGKIIVVVDEKKTSTKNFLRQKYPNIKVLNGSEASKVGDYLSATTKNFVILDTGSIQTALSTTNALISKLSTYDIQLATFDKNEVFDYTEISLNALTKLKLLYASVTRENETENGTLFANTYKKQNNIYPNRFATRGFDVTFDVILRMFQNDSFQQTTRKYTTQQVENKFAYKTLDEGVYNQGVYLLYYDEDLTVKNIN